MGRKRTKGKRVNPLEALAALSRAVSGTDYYIKERQEILNRYARKFPSGRPMLCQPSRQEMLGGEVSGAFKVIYDSDKDAKDAARELCALGAPPMEPYPCPRSRHGHLHLKTIKRYRNEKKGA